MDSVFSIKVHSVGLGQIRKTYNLSVSSNTLLEALYGLIETTINDQYIRKRQIAATLAPLDMSKIGRFWFRDGSVTSDYPDAKPTFVLDKTDPQKPISECGVTDGVELVIDNGMKD